MPPGTCRCNVSAAYREMARSINKAGDRILRLLLPEELPQILGLYEQLPTVLGSDATRAQVQTFIDSVKLLGKGAAAPLVQECTSW